MRLVYATQRMTAPHLRARAESPLLEVDAAGEKDVGGRDHDEDAILLRPDLSLFAVADGAGGENAGNVASSIALASMVRHYEGAMARLRHIGEPQFDTLGLPVAARRLSSAIHQANREVVDISRTADRYRGMGTTVAALAFDLAAGVVHLAHVGDSRCYRLRAGRLEQLTQDHSLAQDVLELSPDLDDAAAGRLPRNVITRALGMGDKIRVSLRSLDLALEDRFLLCSDGLTDVLSDEEIAETMLSTAGPRESAYTLLARAKGMPLDDNCSLVVVRVVAAIGVTAVPKRYATRPAPGSRSPEPASEEAPIDSGQTDPEIVIVDQDAFSDDEPSIHIVPTNARTSGALAWQDIMIPAPRRSLRDRVRARLDSEPELDATLLYDPDDVLND